MLILHLIEKIVKLFLCEVLLKTILFEVLLKGYCLLLIHIRKIRINLILRIFVLYIENLLR